MGEREARVRRGRGTRQAGDEHAAVEWAQLERVVVLAVGGKEGVSAHVVDEVVPGNNGAHAARSSRLEMESRGWLTGSAAASNAPAKFVSSPAGLLQLSAVWR